VGAATAVRRAKFHAPSHLSGGAQTIDQELADVVIDPFVAAGNGLPIHDHVPLLRGDDIA